MPAVQNRSHFHTSGSSAWSIGFCAPTVLYAISPVLFVLNSATKQHKQTPTQQSQQESCVLQSSTFSVWGKLCHNLIKPQSVSLRGCVLSVGEGTHKIFMMPLMRKQIGQEFCWKWWQLFTDKQTVRSFAGQDELQHSQNPCWWLADRGLWEESEPFRQQTQDERRTSRIRSWKDVFFGGVISSFFYNCENGIWYYLNKLGSVEVFWRMQWGRERENQTLQ